MNKTLLQTDNLTVHYDGAMALNNLSLTVEEGSIVTLLGANGAGKTTLLRTISGLKRPTQGQIHFFNIRIDQMPAHKVVSIGIGHCPEGRRLFSEMTVIENLKMGAYLRKSRNEIKMDLEKIYRIFPVIEERTNQRAGTLSGGQQQMLAIARALICKPRLLLLDEPSVGLSPLLVRELSRVVTEIRQQGVSVLLVEQNARMALSISDYAYVIEKGEIRIEGTSTQVAGDSLVRKIYLGV